MAVNKNFVVKNGLEVDTNTLFVDSANNRVAIGTTVPTAALDVRGKILSDSQVESWVGKFVGIVTAGAVGVTTMTATDAGVTYPSGTSTEVGVVKFEVPFAAPAQLFYQCTSHGAMVGILSVFPAT